VLHGGHLEAQVCKNEHLTHKGSKLGEVAKGDLVPRGQGCHVGRGRKESVPCQRMQVAMWAKAGGECVQEGAAWHGWL